MNTNFLPENYTPPTSSGNYTKLAKGENKIRILTLPVLGWEDWLDKKPIRFNYNNKPKPVDPERPVKHFWAFVVWNYNEEKIQILQVTQSTILNSLVNLVKDPDWGAPYHYDVKITKSGEGVNTKYNVNPVAPKALSEKIKSEFYAKRCNLNAMFEGGDPFGLWPEYTPAAFEEVSSSDELARTA
jgi:hypothetical protein